jgi:hypothetical protein
MSKTYSKPGLSFTYPEDWTLAEERGDVDSTISVSDGTTSLWSLTLMPGRPEPDDVMSESIKAFTEEYDDIELEEFETELAGHDALAIDFDFSCFELLNSAFLRCFQTETHTVLVMYQATDDEMEILGPVFEAINKSLKCE